MAWGILVPWLGIELAPVPCIGNSVLTIGPPGKSQCLYPHMGPLGVSSPESKAPDAWFTPACSGHLTDSLATPRTHTGLCIRGSIRASEGAQTSGWAGRGVAGGNWEKEGRQGCGGRQLGKGETRNQRLRRRGPTRSWNERHIWAEPIWMGVPTSLRAPRWIRPFSSHSLSAALSRHPAAELCETSFINPVKAEIPWAQKGNCHGKLRTVSPNSASSEFKVLLGRWDQGPKRYHVYLFFCEEGAPVMGETCWIIKLEIFMQLR